MWQDCRGCPARAALSQESGQCSAAAAPGPVLHQNTTIGLPDMIQIFLVGLGIFLFAVNM